MSEGSADTPCATVVPDADRDAHLHISACMAANDRVREGVRLPRTFRVWQYQLVLRKDGWLFAVLARIVRLQPPRNMPFSNNLLRAQATLLGKAFHCSSLATFSVDIIALLCPALPCRALHSPALVGFAPPRRAMLGFAWPSRDVLSLAWLGSAQPCYAWLRMQSVDSFSCDLPVGDHEAPKRTFVIGTEVSETDARSSSIDNVSEQ